MGGIVIDWQHPAVQQLLYQTVTRVMDRFIPPQSTGDPYAEHLSRTLDILDRHLSATGTLAAPAAGAGLALAASTPPAGPPPAPATAVATDPPAPEGPRAAVPAQPAGLAPAGADAMTPVYSRYLEQEGALDDWDTGCLHCGKAHLAAVRGMIERAKEIAAVKGAGDPKVQEYLGEAGRELTALLLLDWTPERIAKAPPDHQAILHRYVGQVQELRDTLNKGGMMDVLGTWSMLDEAGRFAHEDGVTHPEAQLRLARAEELAALAERHSLSPEHVMEMDVTQQQAVEYVLPRLRRLRQYVFDGVAEPKDLDQTTAAAAHLVGRLQQAGVGRLSLDEISTAADKAIQVREGFRTDVQALTQQEQLRRATQAAAAVAGGDMTPGQAQAALSKEAA